MFETAVVRERGAARRRYGLLTMSLAAHTLVVAGIVAASVASVSFPKRAPKEMPAFSLLRAVSLPLPRGNPSGTTASVQRGAAPRTATPAAAVTAPVAVPDSLSPAQAGSPDASGSGVADSPGGRYGAEDGDENGIDAGQPASGSADGSPGTTYAPGGEVRAAMALQRVEPEYPRAALFGRIAGVVVLRCVIGKNGEVRDAEVVRSSFAAFDRPALDALRQWRFAPGSLHGRPVDTWFELTIRFAPR